MKTLRNINKYQLKSHFPQAEDIRIYLLFIDPPDVALKKISFYPEDSNQYRNDSHVSN